MIAELKLTRDANARTESYFCQAEAVALTSTHIATLKARLVESGGHCIRISLHRSPNDVFHQMVIVMRKGAPMRMHRHADTEESHHVIEGRLVVVTPDAKGFASETIFGAPGSGLPFLSRVRANVWHDTLPETEFVVFVESKSGPFKAAEFLVKT